MSTQRSQTRLAPRACEVCEQRDQLLRCSSCQVIHYCSREHQAFDRPDHEYSCKAVKRARTRLKREEQNLRGSPGDLFETGVGRFWEIPETNPYVLARHALVDALLVSFGRPGARTDAVQVSLDHSLDIQRLSRAENLGISDIIPALYIRLDREQEAYDFVKWYATTGTDPNYDWGNPDLPFLDVKNADVFEALEGNWIQEYYIDFAHVIAVTLIKTKVLRDLQAIQNTQRALHRNLPLPTEIIDLIREQMVGSILKSRPRVFSASVEEIASLIDKIKGQVKQLFMTISNCNSSFWGLMIDEAEAALLNSRVDGYSLGSPEQSCLFIGYCYASWAETPGAIPEIRALRDHINNKRNKRGCLR